MLYAKWSDKWSITVTTTRASVTISVNGGASNPVSDKIYVMDGDAISITATAENDKIDTFTVTGKTTTKGNKIETCEIESVNSNISINVVGNNKSCIVEGTLVTLADGTKKAIEDVNVGDVVMVFNHETGKIDYSKIIINQHKDEQSELRKILNLKFSDGNILRIVGDHGLFDVTLGEYVFMDCDNVSEYVGHVFYSVDNDSNAKEIVLVETFETEENIRIFSPMTALHFNVFANNILTVLPLPYGLCGGTANFFEYDENLMFNEEQMQADIEKYGLMEYEEVKEYLPYEWYVDMNIKYMKVVIGKGLLTWEDYVKIFEYMKETYIL
jgi:hypothetical protein